MTLQTEVNVDFDKPSVVWGVPDVDYPPVEFVLNIRELPIAVTIHGSSTLQRSEIRAHLQRALKYFIRDHQLHQYVQYKKTILYRMANYSHLDVDEWANHVVGTFDDKSNYNIWSNVARPYEMLVMDTNHKTSIVTNRKGLDIGKPVGMEFVKSEGGVVFNHHSLGLSAQTHQAEAGLKIRRDMARRTRGGGQFSSFGLLELREVGSLVELWIGEDHLWSIDPTNPQAGIIPNLEYFTDWEATFAISDPGACRYMALYTANQLKLID